MIWLDASKSMNQHWTDKFEKNVEYAAKQIIPPLITGGSKEFEISREACKLEKTIMPSATGGKCLTIAEETSIDFSST